MTHLTRPISPPATNFFAYKTVVLGLFKLNVKARHSIQEYLNTNLWLIHFTQFDIDWSWNIITLHNFCSMLIKQLIDLRKVRTENLKFKTDLQDLVSMDGWSVTQKMITCKCRSQVLKKSSNPKLKLVNAGQYMAFKQHISFATNFAANFGCCWFRINFKLSFHMKKKSDLSQPKIYKALKPCWLLNCVSMARVVACFPQASLWLPAATADDLSVQLKSCSKSLAVDFAL